MSNHRRTGLTGLFLSVLDIDPNDWTALLCYIFLLASSYSTLNPTLSFSLWYIQTDSFSLFECAVQAFIIFLLFPSFILAYSVQEFCKVAFLIGGRLCRDKTLNSDIFFKIFVAMLMHWICCSPMQGNWLETLGLEAAWAIVITEWWISHTWEVWDRQSVKSGNSVLGKLISSFNNNYKKKSLGNSPQGQGNGAELTGVWRSFPEGTRALHPQV